MIPGFKFLVPIYFEMSVADRHHDFFGLRTITARRTRNLYICFLKKLLSSATGATKFGRTRELTVRSSCTQYPEVFLALKDLERSVTVFSYYSHITC